MRPQDGPYPSGRPHQVMAYVGGHSVFIAGAAAIAALAFALSTAVMLSGNGLRGTPPQQHHRSAVDQLMSHVGWPTVKRDGGVLV